MFNLCYQIAWIKWENIIFYKTSKQASLYNKSKNSNNKKTKRCYCLQFFWKHHLIKQHVAEKYQNSLYKRNGKLICVLVDAVHLDFIYYN